MSDFCAGYTYVHVDGADLFTALLLPDGLGKFPVIVMRTPYVNVFEETPEEEICDIYKTKYALCLERGYAVVLQHCRGRGKSTGDFVPYIQEQQDTRALYAWIRKQSFYNGELYLRGASYCASLHYCASPFDSDVKGAVFGVQDPERYNVCYRNGFMKKGLHGEWYVEQYKAKTMKTKNYTKNSFEMLPLCNFTKTVFGESVPDFDAMLHAPHPTDAFWKTHEGGSDARDAVKAPPFPCLFTTAFFDLYMGGIFDMWHKMDKKARAGCALVVSPNDHGDRVPDPEVGYVFPNSTRTEAFGEGYEIDWFDAIRLGKEFPFATGKVTYYTLFENKWHTDLFKETDATQVTLSLGDGVAAYDYDPADPPRFRGGLSRAFGGGVYQDAPHTKQDIITVYTPPFDRNTYVKGQMRATLRVCSNCEDTCFYVRVSIEKASGDLGVRDDITSLSYALGNYESNSRVDLNFTFDEISMLIEKGERLRIDIASADCEHYVRHTNQKGAYCEQTEARVAHNQIFLSDSCLMLPIETRN